MTFDMTRSIPGDSTESDDYAATFARDIGTFEVSPVHEAAVRHLAPVSGKRVLDIGCGEGELVGLLAAQGAEAVGADYVEQSVATARQNVPGARFEVADARSLPFPDGSFDAVVALGVIGYLDDADSAAFLAECRRVLAPGGALLFRVSTPLSGIGHALLGLLKPGYASRARRLPLRVIRERLGSAGLVLERSWLAIDAGKRDLLRTIAFAILFPVLAQRWVRARR